MAIKILVDNIAQSALQPEWRLAVYIGYRSHKILLDTGHCTGVHSMELLRQELGERVEHIYTGMDIL